MKDEKELIFRSETYQIIGAAIEVHTVLGPGFLEAVYHEAMEIELTARKIPFESHKKLKIPYKSNILKQPYEADFLIFDKIIVEIKALETLITKHHAQVLNYLKATKKRVGLLINFGEMSLVNKRFIL